MGDLSPQKEGRMDASSPRLPAELEAVKLETTATTATPTSSSRRTVVDKNTTGHSSTPSQKWQNTGRKQQPAYKVWSRDIVENNFFISFTMLLTIYALLGDDMRILCTNQSADPIFTGMVVVCIVVFSFEFALSCIGKADYRWSFFFWLDLISTLSLFLDIPVITETLMNSGDEEDGNANDVRSGRAAKIGAKAGRVVRVLRLVRILKLYKAYYEAQAREKRRQQAKKGPGEDDEWDEDDLAQDSNMQNGMQDRESHVGRKLSETTTRRVICLILAMLLGLPIMQADIADQAALSANLGADIVWQHFNHSVEHPSSTAKKAKYEGSLLRFIYYHNWFARANEDSYCVMGDCSNNYFAQLWWVGIEGKDTLKVEEMASKAYIQNTNLDAWESSNTDITGIYNLGKLPDEAHDLLTTPWTENCDSKTWISRGVSLLSEEIDGAVSHTINCPKDLRPTERMPVSGQLLTKAAFDDYHMTFYFDLRPFVRMEATYNIINTFNILVLLVCVSLLFSNDANTLIVHPVERMIKRVEAIRDDPLIAMKMADEEFKAEEVAKAKKARAKKERIKSMIMDVLTMRMCKSASSSSPMETVILEKTIIKLGSLLALGFGEAGANIVSTNMRGGDSAGVNAMIPGTRVECIIGCVRLRDFSTATEVLQSKIMTFVNQVAEIVHGVVDAFHGAPNRNSGESFLIIWRIEPTVDAATGKVMSGKHAPRLAGLSVVAFSRILGALHRSPVLATYRGHPGLQYRLGSGCRVNLSFGLHAGWAIEGAVGSEFKIDASYLSPNVSIATSVERATQIYGVSLIVAQSVVELCSKPLVEKCRLIDNVIVKGSVRPMELYCVDLDYRAVQVDDDPPLKIVWNTRNRFKVRQFLESEKTVMESDNLDLASVFEGDAAITDMRRRYTVEFFQLFNMGYQNYSQGEWQVARRMLSCTRAILGAEDGPSSALLRHMEVPHQFEAPREWRGVRELVAPTAADH